MNARGRAGAWIAVVLLLLAVAATLVNFYFLSSETAEEEPSLVEAPPPPLEDAEPMPTEAPVAEGTPAEEPSLEGTDELVRRLAAGLSSRPEFAKWLATDDLIRRFVVVVVNVAEGTAPRKPLSFLAPDGSFRTVERGGRPFVDPRSYRRYDLFAEVVASIDAQGCSTLYRELEPQIEAAYHELGYPGRDFDDTLAKAMRNLLEVPVVEGEIPLDPRVTTHEFASNELEGLNPAKKQLLRMGPENIRKIQAKLRELEGALFAAQAAGTATPETPATPAPQG
ncbi:MAG: DUF3014 domain-containing protein [Candidatus Binatia bacterium]